MYSASSVDGEVLAPLTYAQRVEVADRRGYIERVKAQARAGGLVAALKAVAASAGVRYGTMRRWYYAAEKSGDAALVDARKTVRPPEENAYYREFCRYCEMDRNGDRGGYDALMRDFRRGFCFSFGTWRDCWTRDYPCLAVPPLCPANYVPRGFTYQRMMQLRRADGTRAMALAWTRQGQFAALRHTLPVIRSRVGLRPGQVVQSDDVWHNVDVYAPGQKGVFNPLEFAFYDVASAYKIVSLMKPRTLVVDPKTGRERRDNLKEQQYRFAVANLMCCVDFHKDGITLIGERGTSRLNDEVLRRIAASSMGRLFRFQTSGLKNAPAHRGMFVGNAGGNPRMKSLCECAHNVLHNATASLPGSHGRDAAHLHESNAAVVGYSERMVAQAERIDPAILPLLRLPILDYKTYRQYFYAIEAEVMDRTEHRLEGWEENEVSEFRLSPGSPWVRADALKDMDPAKAAAVSAVVSSDPANLMRRRKLSRREAWARGRGELVRWPLAEAPAFLDPRDAREATVRPDGTIAFTDAQYYPGEQKRYVARYRDRRTGVERLIAPGTKVRFFWIPVGPLENQIWITDEKDDVLGMCPLLKTASWSDECSIRAAMGQQLAQTAALMAETRAAGEMAGVRRLAAEKVNAAILAAAKEAKSRPTRTGGGGRASLEELASGSPPRVDAEEAAPGGGFDAAGFLAQTAAARRP